MNAPDALTIDVPTLRLLLERLLRQVEDQCGPRIYIARDHYWLLELDAALSEDLHVPGTADGDLGVGQISDDIASVAAGLAELETEGEVSSVWHEIEHAVGLLRALAWRDIRGGD